MKVKVFTVKLDPPTERKLTAMAKASERSRGAIVRLLIKAANPDAFSGVDAAALGSGEAEAAHAA